MFKCVAWKIYSWTKSIKPGPCVFVGKNFNFLISKCNGIITENNNNKKIQN